MDLGEVAGGVLGRLWNLGLAEASAFDPDFVAHVPERAPLFGVSSLLSYVEGYKAAFPDLSFAVHATVVEGDEVMVRAGMTGTQLGGYDGIPATGRPVVLTDLVWLSFRDGKVVELWRQTNNLAVLDQLGILPPEDAGPLRQLGHTLATVGRLAMLKAKEYRNA